MPDRPAGFLARLARTPPADLAAATDADLLDRFAADPHDAPFAELVRRHGPMVLGVCRRVLRHAEDADDAFQAAFLVLARNAAASRGRPVGGWLYRVAGNVARRLRDQNRRRRTREDRSGRVASVEPAPPADGLAAVLDDELNRLPDRERAAVVACLLEGRTQEEAARELGWTVGTLRRRLGRGKELLRNRLTRRGVTAPVGFVGIVVFETVPHALADGTRVAAVGFARGVKTATPAVALAEGIIAMMTRTKVAAVFAAVVAAAGLTVGTGVALQQPAADPVRGGGGQPPAKGTADPGFNTTKAGPFDAATDKGAIKPGERIFIHAEGTLPNADIKGIYTVEPGGQVSLGPAYGRVRVAGSTYQEAEVVIRTFLKDTLRNPMVAVTAVGPDEQLLAARVAALEARVRTLEEIVARLRAKE
jgi:RNA polymerase sigma factor (sigma-70 family)